jgi:hypothetical protein
MSAPNDGTARNAFDKADPNTLADLFRQIALGSLLQGQLTQVRRGVSPHALGISSYTPATVDALHLPDTGRACVIHRATVRGVGELTIDAFGTTPSTGHIAVAPNGDIVTLTSDNYADLDVVYTPERGDVVEIYMPVASNAIVIPTSITARKVVLLLEAESLEGTLVSKLKVLVPSDTNSTSGAACLNLARSSVVFASANAITRARVKFLVRAKEDLCTVLEANSSVI